MISPSAQTEYADWKAPAGDGEILIWPDGSRLLADTRQNQALFEAEEKVRLLGIPVAEVRRAARSVIGHTEARQPLVATGHQAELWHAGVWIKNAVIDAVATKLGGEAYHFCVDTDSPKHLNLRWPDSTADSLPITDDERRVSANWTGQLAAPSVEHVAHIRAKLQRVGDLAVFPCD